MAKGGLNSLIKYPKIETVFERDVDGSKKLIDGKYRSETVEYLKDNQWYFTEKIDGTNIGIVWDGHRVSLQGRTERASIPAELVNELSNIFISNEAEEMFEQKFGEQPVILYGEGYGGKIQNGKMYRNDHSFILFDVYLPNKDLWLKRDSIENIAKSFGIDAVPIVMEGTIDQAVDFVKSSPPSTIGNAKMEGVVGKPYVDMIDRNGKRVIVKIKVCDFRSVKS